MSSNFILAAVADDDTAEALPVLELLFTPDDLTLFVWATLSRNLRSSLKKLKVVNTVQ